MTRIRFLSTMAVLSALGGCAEPLPPCQDMICIHQRQIDAYQRQAALDRLSRLAATMGQPPSGDVYIIRRSW